MSAQWARRVWHVGLAFSVLTGCRSMNGSAPRGESPAELSAQPAGLEAMRARANVPGTVAAGTSESEAESERPQPAPEPEAPMAAAGRGASQPPLLAKKLRFTGRLPESPSSFSPPVKPESVTADEPEAQFEPAALPSVAASDAAVAGAASNRLPDESVEPDADPSPNAEPLELSGISPPEIALSDLRRGRPTGEGSADRDRSAAVRPDPEAVTEVLTLKPSDPARVLHDEAITQSSDCQPAESLSIDNLSLCTQVFGFGRVANMPASMVHPGQQMLLYAEAREFASRAGPNVYETTLKGAIVIENERGEPVASFDFDPIVDECANRRTDFFCHFTFSLPPSVGPGNYVARLQVTDLISGASDERTLPFVVYPEVEVQ
jgi:hypothetical protein